MKLFIKLEYNGIIQVKQRYPLIIFLFTAFFTCQKNATRSTELPFFKNKSHQAGENSLILKEKVKELKKFLKGKKYNQDLAFFIDYKITSGKFRFFIYDLKADKILEKGLVAHGSGSLVEGSSVLKFSNVENSYQSSLGKFEIGNSYQGIFGKSYRLKGLDATNSMAMKRAVVLHPYHCIADEEQEQPSCLSLGCPMLSENFFVSVAKYIDSSENTMVMYSYY